MCQCLIPHNPSNLEEQMLEVPADGRKSDKLWCFEAGTLPSAISFEGEGALHFQLQFVHVRFFVLRATALRCTSRKFKQFPLRLRLRSPPMTIGAFCLTSLDVAAL